MYPFLFWRRPQPYWKSFKLLISPRILRIQHIYTVCKCFMLTVLSSSKSLNALRISSLESFSLWKEITKISDKEKNLQYCKGYNTVQLHHLHLVWKKIVCSIIDSVDKVSIHQCTVYMKKKIFLLSQNMQQHKIKRGKQKLTVHGSLFLNVVQKVMCVKLTIFAVIIWRNSLKSIVPKEREWKRSF